MITVRTGPHTAPATPEGPHDPEQTRAIADAVSQAVHLLNYATDSDAGIGHPADVASVYTALAEALDRLPQALDQMNGWVMLGALSGRIQEVPGTGPYRGDTAAAARALASVTTEARIVARRFSQLLSEAQTKVSGLTLTESGGTS
jgi:hypothetical protein